MSEAKRAYNLLRGYINREWDRVKGLEMLDALKELDSPLSDKQAEMKERADGPRATSSASTSPQSSSSSTFTEDLAEENYEATARTILNVHANATFKEVRYAYEKISRRSQPENFPEGSEEAEQAQVLLRRATWAYNFLTKNVSSSEKRFKSLELE